MKNDWERTTNISLISVGLWFCQCRRLNWINIFTNIHVGFDGRWQNVYLFDSKRSRVESFRCCQTKFNNFRSGHRNSEAWKTLGKMIFKILFSNLYFFLLKIVITCTEQVFEWFGRCSRISENVAKKGYRSRMFSYGDRVTGSN